MAGLIRIMMVEDEREICESFQIALMRQPSMKIVFETDSETQALDYLESHEVDIIILDIELKEGDGLSLLDDIEKHRLAKPFIVVVTNTGSSVTLSYMREHGADYIYQKTNLSYSAGRVLSVIEKVYPYQKLLERKRGNHLVEQFNQEKADAITRQYVESELEKIGFRRKQMGFSYTAEAILLILKDSEGLLRMTTDMYPMIAETYNTTGASVERNIRNAIETAFAGAQIDALNQFYPFPYNEEKGRPSNTEFLKNMAMRLKI